MNREIEFAEWYHQVDMEVERISYLSLIDFTDQEYESWFRAGIEPSDAAIMVLLAEGWDTKEGSVEDDEGTREGTKP